MSQNRPPLPFVSESLIVLLSLACSSLAHAAACCGGGFAAPSIIAGDDKAQVTSSLARSQVRTDVYPDGTWEDRSYRETTETLKLEAAHVFWDRFQAGGSVPVIRRARSEDSSAGLGDVSATLGYEYLPDWDYNPWRPKGLGYLQLTLPTGKTIQEAEDKFQLESRGRGFWGLGLGTLLTKIVGSWDVFSSLDVHRSFAKDYSSSLGPGRLEPGWGGNLAAGLGYNTESFRIGGSVAWTYEDAIEVQGANPSSGTPERYGTVSASGSYLFETDWAATLTYSDQALIGSPLNARLGRTVLVQLQRRWSR